MSFVYSQPRQTVDNFNLVSSTSGSTSVSWAIQVLGGHATVTANTPTDILLCEINIQSRTEPPGRPHL